MAPTWSLAAVTQPHSGLRTFWPLRVWATRKENASSVPPAKKVYTQAVIFLAKGAIVQSQVWLELHGTFGERGDVAADKDSIGALMAIDPDV